MRIEKYVYEHVNENGTFPNPEEGAVETRGVVRMSTGEGCSLEHCHCSDGHWITIGLPRTPEGVVEVMTVYFDDGAEMDAFLHYHKLQGADITEVE